MDTSYHGPAAIQLLGGLKYDPAYQHLCDLMQAKLDNLTDELADPTLRDDDAPGKLRYWQAFREIVRTLRVEPLNYAALIEGEPSGAPVEPPPVMQSSTWAKLQQAHYERQQLEE